jgi:hypothetical protein
MIKNRRVSLVAVGVITAAVGGICGSRPARACSRIQEPPVLRGTPADGDIDVPTDVVPVYDLVAAQMYDGVAATAAFSLVDDVGNTVPAALFMSYLTGFELVPATRLRPLTRYTLTGTWTPYSTPGVSVTASLAFTTGAGAWAGSLAAPPTFLQHYYFENVRTTSCDEPSGGTCVSVPAGALTRVTYIDSVGQEQFFRSPTGAPLPYLMTGPFLTNLSGVNQGTDFRCVKLMVRVANGTVGSDATVVCRDDAPTFALNGTPAVGCSPEGLTHNGTLVTQNLGGADHVGPPGFRGDRSGCSVVAARPEGMAGWTPVLLLLAATFPRRSRRSPAR